MDLAMPIPKEYKRLVTEDCRAWLANVHIAAVCGDIPAFRSEASTAEYLEHCLETSTDAREELECLAKVYRDPS
jgi:hypothetical protein